MESSLSCVIVLMSQTNQLLFELSCMIVLAGDGVFVGCCSVRSGRCFFFLI